MSTKITGYQNRPVQVGGDKSVSRPRDAAAGQSTQTGPASPVRITDQARQLAALEAVVKGMPVVNEARVQEIRQAISEARYEISPERIADKLLRLEHELGGAEK